MGIDFMKGCLDLATGDYVGTILFAISFLKSLKSFREENSFLFQVLKI